MCCSPAWPSYPPVAIRWVWRVVEPSLPLTGGVCAVVSCVGGKGRAVLGFGFGLLVSLLREGIVGGRGDDGGGDVAMGWLRRC